MEATSAGASRTARPAGLDASTLAEAFQLTAQAHPERVALRTKDDEFSMTWGEYADKVRAAHGGPRGARPGARWGTRAHAHEQAGVPSLRLGCAASRCHAVLRLQHVHAGAGRLPGEGRRGAHLRDREGLPRPRPGDRRARARRGRRRRRSRRGAHDRRRRGRGRPRVRLRGGLARRRAGGHAHAHLHVGHDRPAEGRSAHPRQRARGAQGLRPGRRLPGRRAGDLVAADGAHRGADGQPLPPDRARRSARPAAPTRARSWPTWQRCIRPGSSRSRASGRS